MSLADYSHWNEDAVAVWWAEEGRHHDEPEPDYDDFDAARELEPDDDEPVADCDCDACQADPW